MTDWYPATIETEHTGPCTCGHEDIQDSSSLVTRRALLQAGAVTGAVVAARPVLRFTPAFASGTSSGGGNQQAFDPRNWPAPSIFTRAQWGADESIRQPGQSYDTPITKIVVHHTVTPNNPSDPSATIRGIYQYHLSQDYIDIAYNWLIDQNGIIYEGRWAQDYAPGQTHNGEDNSGRNVHGAHSSNTNTDTIGIALLGTFSGTAPTDYAIEALINLITWKCARWGIDPLGASQYIDGRVFANICGHRDVTQTECPGDYVYIRLNDIRNAVSANIRPGTAGYWIMDKSGFVVALGDMPNFGDPRGNGVHSTMRNITPNPANLGYWVLGSDGGVFSYGSAGFYGSTGNIRLNQPIVGMTAHPSGNGYWLVAQDGGVFSFGASAFFGSTGNIRLNKPIVGMAATPSGNGYWLVASDGGVFAFGGAKFFGSTGNISLNQPIVGMAATPSGNGYWLVASDGGVFAFGDARFMGSTGGIRLAQPIVDIAATPKGDGYWMLGKDGGIFAFGNAQFYGSGVGQIHEAVGFGARLVGS